MWTFNILQSGLNIQNFTRWIGISLIIRIVKIEISLTIRNTV